MRRMQIRLLTEIIEAVTAMRALAIESPERCSGIEDVANELLLEVSEILVDYERTDAMSFLHKLYRSDLNYDDFVRAVVDYRRPIVGDDDPEDWELCFYAMLMLTEPVFTDEEASDA